MSRAMYLIGRYATGTVMARLPGCLDTKTPPNSPSSAFTLLTANSMSPGIDMDVQDEFLISQWREVQRPRKVACVRPESTSNFLLFSSKSFSSPTPS